MRNLITTCFFIVSLMAVGVQAAPATFKAGNAALVKNGEGVRSLLGIKLYKGSLYLKAKSSNASAIIQADVPMAFKMEITSSLITKDKLSKVVYEGFEKSTGSKTAMRTQVDSLLKVFASGVNKGDVYDLVYIPSVGVKTYKNGKLGATTPGLKFKQALFAIWIGKKPAQSSLKKSLLGK